MHKPKSTLLLFLFLCLRISAVVPGNILVVDFITFKSHKITYMGLVEELGKRGHSVTVLNSLMPTKVLKNVREVHTLDSESELVDVGYLSSRWPNLESRNMWSKIWKICEETYKLPVIKQLLNETFDLVLFQPVLNDCALGFVGEIKAPIILFFPISVPGLYASQLGSYFPPSFVPNMLLAFGSEMNLLERFLNFGETVVGDMVYSLHVWRKSTRLYREFLGDHVPAAEVIMSKASLLMSNGALGMDNHKPHLADIVDVGGLNCRPPKPLPAELERFISKDGKAGFIYFSMGTVLQENQMPVETKQLFAKVFSKLEHPVLWKWNGSPISNLSKNVKTSRWFPQQDVLGHRGLRLFISHCGRGSAVEAVYHGVPVLGLPVVADQHITCKQLESLGAAVMLDWTKLNADELFNAIQRMLKDKRYSKNAKKASKILRDQPQHPLDRAVFWVEYVLRHEGAPHLKSTARNLDVIQYHCIDVIACYLGIAAALVWFLVQTANVALKAASWRYLPRVRGYTAVKAKQS